MASIQGLAGVGWAGACHLDTRHLQGREPPYPNKTGTATHGASTPPSHTTGGRCPPGKGRCPPGDLATDGDPAVLTAHPPTCTPGGTKGSPALLTSPMINFPPPRSVREGPHSSSPPSALLTARPSPGPHPELPPSPGIWIFLGRLRSPMSRPAPLWEGDRVNQRLEHQCWIPGGNGDR